MFIVILLVMICISGMIVNGSCIDSIIWFSISSFIVFWLLNSRIIIIIGMIVSVCVISCCSYGGICRCRKFFIMIWLVSVVVIVEFRFEVNKVMVNSVVVVFMFSIGVSSWWVCLMFFMLKWLLVWNMVVVRIRMLVLMNNVSVNVRVLLVIV